MRTFFKRILPLCLVVLLICGVFAARSGRKDTVHIENYPVLMGLTDDCSLLYFQWE